LLAKNFDRRLPLYFSSSFKQKFLLKLKELKELKEKPFK
jgi:hypothetical protein